MITHQQADRPIRIGVFDTVAQAEETIQRLLQAGFKQDQIGVLCSAQIKEDFFPKVRTATPPGASPGEAITTGGALGASLGGLALAATTLATGGIALLGAGVLLAGGAIAGSFAGAMATLGYDRETTDYYEQAVQQGKILIAVEDRTTEGVSRLAHAEEIMGHAGAEPLVEVQGSKPL